MTTDAEWVQVNMLTGEIRPNEPAHKQRRADAVFTAAVKLWGYEGQPLTKSLRGACNASCRDIKRYEWERDEAHTDDEIAALIEAFDPWFKQYRRERFNEYCRRAPYPMETAKLWPEYRKRNTATSPFRSDWERYKAAHPEVMSDENAPAES